MSKGKAKISVIKNVLFVIRYSYKYCKPRVLSIFAIALFNGINAANVVLFYKYAMESFGKERPLLSLLISVAVYLLLHLLSTVITNVFSNAKYPLWDLKIKNEISKELYQKYIRIDLYDMKNSEFYNQYMRALNEADQRSIQVLNTTQYILSNFFSALGILSVIAILSPLLFVFAVVPVFISFFFNMKITKERYAYEMELTGSNRKIDYVKRIFTLPQYREELRIQDYKDILFQKYTDANDRISKTTKEKMPSIIHKSVLGANLFSLINYSIPAIYLGWQVFQNLISVGEFSTLLIGTANLSSSIFYLVILIPQMAQHAMFIDNLKVILDYKSVMEPTESSRMVDASCNHAVVLDDVSFRYPTGNEDTLKHISLTIGKGEKIALVGENGAGKSTLVKLILRLYDPQSGRLYLDNDDYRDLNVNSLRQAISVVPQNFQSFAFSIGENVLTREIRGYEDEQRIWEALKDSGLSEKIQSLPNRLDTPLTSEFEENGINLSGGESQKLAIARAVYRDTGVLIMDEPSSSLDPLSEYEMYLNMFNLYKDKTMILISHKLYSTKMVDKIYYLENGMIVESGSHDELLRRNGKYASLYRIQADQYNEG